MTKNSTPKPSDFNRAIFIDSSKLEEIKKWNATGVIDGVTTNQLIMLKDGVKPKYFSKVVKQICKEMSGKPVSIELTDSTASAEEMIKEAKRLSALAENIVIKVPLIPNTTKSLWVINQLTKFGIAVNVTCMMTYEQMIMAIMATRKSKKLSFISIFWGRSMEDSQQYRSKAAFVKKHEKLGPESYVNQTPKKLVEMTAAFLKEGGYDNIKIIAGSIRNASMVGEAFAAGTHVPTVTPDVLEAMLFSQRTIETIQQFDDAWKELQAKK